MNTGSHAFFVCRARRGWLFVFAVVTIATTLWFGPVAEETTLECIFASAILGGLVLLAIAASGRIAFGVVLGCMPMLLLMAAANIKFRYLSTPLLAPDLVYYFNVEIGKTLLQYPLIMVAIVAAVVCVPLLLIALWRADRRPRPHAGARIARVGAALAGGTLLALTLTPSGPFASVYAKGMWLAMNDTSLLSDFVISIHNTRVAPPPFRATDAAAANWSLLPATAGTAARRPDIIAVLEESTFDPRMLADCRSSLCDARMFHADANTIAHGWLDVHTWGGGTWTSEFAFLTGLPHTLFGPAGIYAPFNLAPRIRFTLPRLLDADGYRTVGIYPTGGDFMNGRDAYRDYGFDAFYGGQRLGLGWESTDSDVFKALARVVQIERPKAGGKPLFVFVLTLYQHGPHMSPLADNPAPYNRPLFTHQLAPGDKVLDEWLNLNLTNYLQRLSSSDVGMAELETWLRNSGRPSLLLHFGDHQPSFGGAINAMPKSLPAAAGDPQYVTYYMLKGFNLPIQRENYPVVDIAYLGSLVLDAAGVPRDPFFTANTLLRDRCDGHALDCPNTKLRNSYRAWVFGNLDDFQ